MIVSTECVGSDTEQDVFDIFVIPALTLMTYRVDFFTWVSIQPVQCIVSYDSIKYTCPSGFVRCISSSSKPQDTAELDCISKRPLDLPSSSISEWTWRSRISTSCPRR